MAARVGSLLRLSNVSGAYAPSGAVLSRPAKIYGTTLGFARMFLVVGPFLYLGTKMGAEFAGALERYNLFVPEDDD